MTSVAYDKWIIGACTQFCGCKFSSLDAWCNVDSYLREMMFSLDLKKLVFSCQVAIDIQGRKNL